MSLRIPAGRLPRRLPQHIGGGGNFDFRMQLMSQHIGDNPNFIRISPIGNPNMLQGGNCYPMFRPNMVGQGFDMYPIFDRGNRSEVNI